MLGKSLGFPWAHRTQSSRAAPSPRKHCPGTPGTQGLPSATMHGVVKELVLCGEVGRTAPSRDPCWVGSTKPPFPTGQQLSLRMGYP